jgi:hypothetical protein
MTMTWMLRRIGVLAAAALLATAIGAKPLYAAGDNSQATNDDSKKSDTQKTAKKKTHTKTKKETEQTTGTGQMQGYRPDAVPGSGY